MSRKIEFFVPGTPRPRKTVGFGKGRAYRSSGAPDQGFMDRVHAAALQAHGKHGKIEGPVKVTLRFVFPPSRPTERRIAKAGGQVADSPPGVWVQVESAEEPAAHTYTPDLDNLEKLVIDGIKGAVIEDDKMVWHKDSMKVWGKR